MSGSAEAQSARASYKRSPGRAVGWTHRLDDARISGRPLTLVGPGPGLEIGARGLAWAARSWVALGLARHGEGAVVEQREGDDDEQRGAHVCPPDGVE